MTFIERMRDAADASGIPQTWSRAVGGYLRTGDPARAWSVAEWRRFPHNRKLPIVAMSQPSGRNAVADAFAAAQELFALGAPKDCWTALDLETAVDADYVHGYGDAMHWIGYRVLVYGSASTVFGNPALNGYFPADWSGNGPFMYDHPSVVATQYASPSSGSGGPWDSSAVRDWVYYGTHWWR